MKDSQRKNHRQAVHTVQRQARPSIDGSTAQPALQHPATLLRTPSTLLHLQRTHGNRVVSRMVNEEDGSSSSSSTASAKPKAQPKETRQTIKLPPLALADAAEQEAKVSLIKTWGSHSSTTAEAVFKLLAETVDVEGFTDTPIYATLFTFLPEIIYNIYDIVADQALASKPNGTTDGEFDIVIKQTKKQLYLAIRDHGPGLPALRNTPDKHVPATELFSHNKKSEKANSDHAIGGKGIGLANLAQAVGKLQGQFMCMNPKSGGAVFEFIFPF